MAYITSIEPNVNNILTGVTIFSGNKDFNNRPTVNGLGVMLIGEGTGVTGNYLDITQYVTISGIQNIVGQKSFSLRPFVNGTGVLLSGEATNAVGGGGGVTGISITGGDSITGLFNLSAGSNVTLLQNGNSLTISSLTGGGSISTWSNLTWNPTTIWSAQANIYEDRKRLIMTGNTTLSITNLYDGWAGLLQTIQSGNSPSGYSLSLPANTRVGGGGSGIIYLTSGSGIIDMIGFEYDGSKLFASIFNKWS